MKPHTSVKDWNPTKGRELRLASEALGFSASKLAEAASVTKVVVESAFAGRKVQPEVLDQLAEVVDLSGADVTALSALERTCTNWGEAHARALQARMSELGLDLYSAASLTGASTASLRRWLENKTRPRVTTFAAVASRLDLDLTTFSELEGASAGSDLNRFAYELLSIKEESGLSIAGLARRFAVSTATLQCWIQGRGLPTSGTSACRMAEAITGVRVDDVRYEQDLEEEMSKMDLDSLSGIPWLITKRRSDLGLTQAALAERLGSSVQVVRAWETGDTRPSYERSRALAEALEVAPDEVALASQSLPEGTNFHVRLKAARKRALMSSNEVSNAVGSAHYAYNRYEGLASSEGLTGNFPSLSEGRLEDICAVLGVEVEDLFEPDLTVFGHWVGALVDVKGLGVVATVAGVGPNEVLSWSRGESRPSIRQAEALGHFSGDGKVRARALVTGENPAY